MIKIFYCGGDMTDNEFKSLVIQVQRDLIESDTAINRMIINEQIRKLGDAFNALGKEIIEKAIESAKEFSGAIEIAKGITLSVHRRNTLKDLHMKIRFVIADILNLSDKYCWTDLVEWAMFGKELNKNGNECRKESFTEGTCYCGKFCHGKQMKKGSPYKIIN